MQADLRWLSLGLAATLLALAAACGDGGDGGEDATSTPLLTPRETAVTDGTGGGTPNGQPTSPGEPNGGPGPGGIVLRIPPASGAAGAGMTVELLLTGFPEPGLGAWTIDIDYDNGVLAAVDCGTSGGTSLCNAAFDEDTMRFAGAVVDGLVGDTSIGTLTFTCKQAGTSALELSISTFADASVGSPQDVRSSVTLQDGEIVCG